MPNDLTPELLDRLEALAAKATPGPWHINSKPNDHEIVSKQLGLMLFVCCNEWLPSCSGNPAFAQACDPTTITALIALARFELQRREAEQRKERYGD